MFHAACSVSPERWGMEGRNFHQERDGSKGGFRKPFLPTVPLKASPPRLTSFPSPPRGGGGEDFQTSDVCFSPSPTPKEQSPFLLSVEREILQSIRWRPEMDWNSTFRRNCFYFWGVQTGSNRRIPPLDPPSPLQFCRTSKRRREGRF